MAHAVPRTAPRLRRASLLDGEIKSDFDEEMLRELSKVGSAASLLEIADKERLANCSETLGCCLVGGTEQRAHIVGTNAGRNFPLTLGLQARQFELASDG